MEIFTLIWSSAFAINLTFFALFLFIWFKQRERYEHLLFSFAALGAGGVALTELYSFQTIDVNSAMNLVAVQHIPLFLMLVSLTWFIYLYLKTANLRLAQVFTLLWIVCLILNFLSPLNLVYSEVYEIQEITTETGDIFTQVIGEINNFKFIADFASLVFIVYVMLATVKSYKKGSKRKAVTIGGSTLFFILIAGIYTPLLDARIIISPSTISISFLAIIIAMGFELIDTMVKSSILTKEIIAKEKRWQTLLDRMELIIVEVEKGGSIKYVNPFYCDLVGKKCEELTGENFIVLAPEKERKKVKEFAKGLIDQKTFPNFKSTVLTAQNEEKIIDWMNVKIFDSDNNWISTLTLGFDVTQQQKSFDEIKKLKDLLEKENIALREEIVLGLDHKQILGSSDAIKYSLSRIEQVAPTDTTVLLEGETGVGKELFARTIHKISSRSDKPLIKVNCAVIPDNLIESELFGHEKGAFTGAEKVRRGRFELADGATLFLDEIGELPLNLQPKLLRVIEDGEFERLGSNKTIKVDVRIIAATNRVLKEEISKGRFREDLFYRLSVYPISIPPLRKRKEDLPILLDHFVKRFARKLGKTIDTIPKYVMDLFKNYDWPGNIRELRNVIERAVVATNGNSLKVVDKLSTGDNGILANDFKTLDELEKEYILKVIEECNWKISGSDGAANILNLHPNTLRSKMEKLNIKKSFN